MQSVSFPADCFSKPFDTDGLSVLLPRVKAGLDWRCTERKKKGPEENSRELGKIPNKFFVTPLESFDWKWNNLIWRFGGKY